MAQAYEDPSSPKFEGHYTTAELPPSNQVTVVTYNIQKGQKVADAVKAFQQYEPLQQAGIILLQEMDEAGVEHLAEQLSYNYVYYPATVARDGRKVGNAILALWPLNQTDKVILPNRHPITGQMRIAVRATINFGEFDVQIYSVHTETYSTPSSQRKAQVDAVVDDIGPGDTPVIVGGDFNTVSNRSIRRMTEQFAGIGLQRESADVGPTISKLGFTPAAADHIFSRGFTLQASGAVAEVEASDHFPLWAQLALNNKEERP